MKKHIIFTILITLTFLSLNSFKTLGTARGCWFLGDNTACSPDLAACKPQWLTGKEKPQQGMIAVRFENRDGELVAIMPLADILKILNLKDARKLSTFKFHADFPIPDDVSKSLNIKKGMVIKKGEYQFKSTGTDGTVFSIVKRPGTYRLLIVEFAENRFLFRIKGVGIFFKLLFMKKIILGIALMSVIHSFAQIKVIDSGYLELVGGSKILFYKLDSSLTTYHFYTKDETGKWIQNRLQTSIVSQILPFNYEVSSVTLNPLGLDTLSVSSQDLGAFIAKSTKPKYASFNTNIGLALGNLLEFNSLCSA